MQKHYIYSIAISIHIWLRLDELHRFSLVFSRSTAHRIHIFAFLQPVFQMMQWLDEGKVTNNVTYGMNETFPVFRQ